MDGPSGYCALDGETGEGGCVRAVDDFFWSFRTYGDTADALAFRFCKGRVAKTVKNNAHPKTEQKEAGQLAYTVASAPRMKPSGNHKEQREEIQQYPNASPRILGPHTGPKEKVRPRRSTRPSKDQASQRVRVSIETDQADYPGVAGTDP